MQAHASDYAREDWEDDDIFVNHDKSQFLLVRAHCIFANS